ncbi:MAG TPA: circadian clock KaiB family protein [Cytophagaceae bacterium]|jgi:circadian clock protein KaiB|nr:circadian clock KaiB family protein [Cytophagaceae bacterium]
MSEKIQSSKNESRETESGGEDFFEEKREIFEGMNEISLPREMEERPAKERPDVLKFFKYLNPPGKVKPKFILFVSGMSTHSIQAVDSIRKLGEEHLQDFYELEIVDLHQENERSKAEAFQVLVLPTLLRVEPKPFRRAVGDLADKEKLLKFLKDSDDHT